MLGLVSLAGLSGTDVPQAQACELLYSNFSFFARGEARASGLCERLYSNGIVLRNDSNGFGSVEEVLSNLNQPLDTETQVTVNKRIDYIREALSNLRSAGYSLYKRSRASTPVQRLATAAETYFSPAPQPMGPPSPAPAQVSVSRAQITPDAPENLWDAFTHTFQNVTTGIVEAKIQRQQQKTVQKQQRMPWQQEGLSPSSGRSNTVTYVAIGGAIIALGLGIWLLSRK